MRVIAVFLGALLALTSVSVREGALGQVTQAPSYPAPKQGDWIAKDFRFHTGEIMPELRLHYTTVGAPSGEPVVVLHGTTGSGTGMLSPTFAGELFGPGQPLDAAKYYIILPDAIGHGKSAKPSDGLRAKFPQYDYDDMVVAQYRLVTEGLGVRHARMVVGFSMGGMHVWMWGETYPDFMDTLVPMASQPSAMSSRNWMMRRLITDSIRNDPDWKDGNYASQPRSAAVASVFYGIATAGGTRQLYQKLAPTREAADKLLDQRLAGPIVWLCEVFDRHVDEARAEQKAFECIRFDHRAWQSVRPTHRECFAVQCRATARTISFHASPPARIPYVPRMAMQPPGFSQSSAFSMIVACSRRWKASPMVMRSTDFAATNASSALPTRQSTFRTPRRAASRRPTSIISASRSIAFTCSKPPARSSVTRPGPQARSRRTADAVSCAWATRFAKSAAG